jgi:hypothetical protein
MMIGKRTPSIESRIDRPMVWACGNAGKQRPIASFESGDA